MHDERQEPWARQFDLDPDMRLQITQDGCMSVHNTPADLFEAMPGCARVAPSGTSWKQYGAVTFFRTHAK